MRRALLLVPLFLAGCATPALVTTSPSQQVVTSLELDYVQKFLVPAAAYHLRPHCPQPLGIACSDPALADQIKAAQVKTHAAIFALRDFADASPQADASTLIASARQTLAAAEALLPAPAATP